MKLHKTDGINRTSSEALGTDRAHRRAGQGAGPLKIHSLTNQFAMCRAGGPSGGDPLYKPKAGGSFAGPSPLPLENRATCGSPPSRFRMAYGTGKGKDQENDDEEQAIDIPGGNEISDPPFAGCSVVRHRPDPDAPVGRPARMAFLGSDCVVGGHGRGPVSLRPEGLRTAGG